MAGQRPWGYSRMAYGKSRLAYIGKRGETYTRFPEKARQERGKCNVK